MTEASPAIPPAISYYLPLSPTVSAEKAGSPNAEAGGPNPNPNPNPDPNPNPNPNPNKPNHRGGRELQELRHPRRAQGRGRHGARLRGVVPC